MMVKMPIMESEMAWAVARSLPDVKADSGYGTLLRDWICGVILVYACLFGVGKILLLQACEGLVFLAVAAAAAWVIWRDTKHRGSGSRGQGTGEEKDG